MNEENLNKSKRIPHNKGKKEEVKHIYYTDGNTSIRIPETQEPPEGFTRGRLKRKMSESERASFNEKREKTSMERYGNPTYNNTDKRKSTCIKRYGVENP